MEFDSDVSIVRYPLRFTGLWPLEHGRCVAVKFTIALAFNVFGLILCVYRILLTDDTIIQIKFIFYSIIFSAASICMCVLKKKAISMIKVLKWMEENREIYRHLPPESQIIMKERTIKTKRIVIFYYFLTGSCLACAIFGPIVVSLVNPVLPEMPLSVRWYPLFLTIFAVPATYCAITISGIQCSVILTILHVCAQINVLCCAINTHKQNMMHTVMDHDTEYICCNCLKCIVNRHGSIAKISTDIEDYVNLMLFVKLLMNGFAICIAGFLLLTNEISMSSKLATIIIHVSLLVWTSFIFGWLGEQLLQHGYRIGDAIYSSNWYESQQSQERQILSLIICRAQKPMKITSGKFFSVTLKTIGQLFITWISYISVLNAVRSSLK